MNNHFKNKIMFQNSIIPQDQKLPRWKTLPQSGTVDHLSVPHPFQLKSDTVTIAMPT